MKKITILKKNDPSFRLSPENNFKHKLHNCPQIAGTIKKVVTTPSSPRNALLSPAPPFHRSSMFPRIVPHSGPLRFSVPLSMTKLRGAAAKSVERKNTAVYDRDAARRGIHRVRPSNIFSRRNLGHLRRSLHQTVVYV